MTSNNNPIKYFSFILQTRMIWCCWRVLFIFYCHRGVKLEALASFQATITVKVVIVGSHRAAHWSVIIPVSYGDSTKLLQHLLATNKWVFFPFMRRQLLPAGPQTCGGAPLSDCWRWTAVVACSYLQWDESDRNTHTHTQMNWGYVSCSKL